MSGTEQPTPDEVRSTATMTATGTRFPTLAAAVAARDIPGSPDTEMTCLAAAVFHESANQPLAGQLAVANVLLNRVKSGRFASTVCGVLKQPGQFSFVRRGVVPTYHSDPRYRTSLAIAQIALDKQWADPAPGAMYFHATYISPGWKRARVATIGQHVFYR